MSGIRKYFKRQFQREMFTLQYEDASDFYISAFQRNRSPLPLLCFRGILFLGCILILLASLILTSLAGIGSFWIIYMTHWGLILITLASGFAFGVSSRAYLKGPIDATFGLPWYVKCYWITYTIAINVAFFITIFYWTFLAGDNEEYAEGKILDIFIHAINSVIMFLLLMSARHPTNILHFYFPFVFSIVYVIFTVIYYFADGVDPFGNAFVYPVLYWAKPGIAMIMVVISAILIIIIQFICSLLTVARDAMGGGWESKSSTFTLSA